jgi:hypothetical protein
MWLHSTDLTLFLIYSHLPDSFLNVDGCCCVCSQDTSLSLLRFIFVTSEFNPCVDLIEMDGHVQVMMWSVYCCESYPLYMCPSLAKTLNFELDNFLSSTSYAKRKDQNNFHHEIIIQTYPFWKQTKLWSGYSKISFFNQIGS